MNLKICPKCNTENNLCFSKCWRCGSPCTPTDTVVLVTQLSVKGAIHYLNEQYDEAIQRYDEMREVFVSYPESFGLDGGGVGELFAEMGAGLTIEALLKPIVKVSLLEEREGWKERAREKIKPGVKDNVIEMLVDSYLLPKFIKTQLKKQ